MLRNFFNNNSPDLSIQQKVCHLLKWGREYAEEIDLSEDLIARSMYEGIHNPNPRGHPSSPKRNWKEYSQIIRHKSLSPLETKERNNRIQALKRAMGQASTRITQYEDLRKKLSEALMQNSQEFLMTESTEKCSTKANERLKWQMTTTAQILLQLVSKNFRKTIKLKSVIESIEVNRTSNNIFQIDLILINYQQWQLNFKSTNSMETIVSDAIKVTGCEYSRKTVHLWFNQFHKNSYEGWGEEHMRE